MVAVMRKAASLGDDECQQQQRLISALATENKVICIAFVLSNVFLVRMVKDFVQGSLCFVSWYCTKVIPNSSLSSVYMICMLVSIKHTKTVMEPPQMFLKNR